MRKFNVIRLEKTKIEEDFYSGDSREGMIEDDMLSPLEAAFMKGWDEAE